LGGLDALVFTGGIGENDAGIRADVAAGCRWLGLQLDTERNKRGSGRVSTDISRVPLWVVPTDEERMVARHTSSTLGLVDAQGASR
jgi:acetate kinase